MRHLKRTPYGVTTRTRYAHLRFTDDPLAMGNVLKPAFVGNCYYTEEGIQSFHEWTSVFSKSKEHYRCNISNLLEVGAWKVQNENTDGYEDFYYMISSSGGFYLYVESVNAFQTIVLSKGKIVACPLMGKNATQYALFTSNGFYLVNTDATYKTVIESGTVAAGAYFRHRVFVGMKNGVLKYSAPENFVNFSESVEEGGSIRFPDGGGEIIAVKVFEDALYIFFKSGIIRLEVGGDPCEFRAEKIPYSGGDIIPRTICVCDQYVYFAAKHGIYRLQGKKVERLPIEIKFPLTESGLEGCSVWKGMPVIRFREANGSYRTFVVRPDGTELFIMDLPGLGRGENGKVLFVDSRKYLYEFAERGQGSVWNNGSVMTVKSDLGYIGKKCLRKLTFYGEGNFSVSVLNGGRTYTKFLTFENGMAEYSLKIPGEQFSFIFDIDRATKIRGVYAEFETLTRYKEVKK